MINGSMIDNHSMQDKVNFQGITILKSISKNI